MHLSNIFDYLGKQKIIYVLSSLVPYVNNGGKIYFEYGMNSETKPKNFHDFCSDVSNKYNQEWKFRVKYDGNRKKCIMQRTR